MSKPKIKVTIEDRDFRVEFNGKEKVFSLPALSREEKDFLAMIAVRELINNLPTIAKKLASWQDLDRFVKDYLQRNFYGVKKEKKEESVVW